MGNDLQLAIGLSRKPLSRTVRPRERASSGPRPRLGPAALRVLLFDESPEEFRQFYQELAGALAPKDALDDLLVERIATSAWRLRRVYRIESGLFSKARVSAHNGTLKRTRDIELVFLRLTANDDTLAKLSRYEASLERSLLQATQQFLCRQLRRQPYAMIAPNRLIPSRS
jgi:hypothetical protein